MERIYRKHKDNQLDIFYLLQQLMGGGEILRIFWGKLDEAEVNIPLESMEKCMGKKQTVWRGCFLLMQCVLS
jgi:hypothetical protein